MRCADFRERVVELFDAAPDSPVCRELHEHLGACTACAGAYEELRRTMAALTPAHPIVASAHLKEKVMNEIIASAQRVRPVRKPWLRLWKPVMAATGALVVLVGASFAVWLGRTHGEAPMSAFAVLGQAAHAMANLQTVHIKARMRTKPGECFDQIFLGSDFMAIEMWKEFAAPQRWRVEKPDRVVVMDGRESTLWIPADKMAASGTPETGFVQWLRPLMDADSLLDRELRLAQQEGSNLSLTHESGATGADELVLRTESSAKGDFSTSEYARNSSILTSDNLRIYRFDSETKRMIGLQVYVHTPNEDVLVFETTDVRYDELMDPALFALAVPKDANWFTEPQTPGAVPEASTPEDLARVFLEACGAQDWTKALRYMPFQEVPVGIKKEVGGAQLLSIGKPFQSGLYPGWFVPYELKLKSGEIRQGNLAVRNDNPAKQFVFDGGI